MRTTRERILVAVAAVAVLYGLYALVLRPRTAPEDEPESESPEAAEPGTTRGEELLSWILANRDRFEETTLSPFEQAVLARAREPWRPGVFLESPLPEAVRKALEREKEKQRERRLAEAREKAAEQEADRRRREEREALLKPFTYSGYVLGRNGPSVVINGVAYRQGEKLVDHPYRVAEMTPEVVVLEAMDADLQLTVPLKKEAAARAEPD